MNDKKKFQVVTSPETLKEVGQKTLDRVTVGGQKIEVSAPSENARIVCGDPSLAQDTEFTRYLPAICGRCGKDVVIAHYNAHVKDRICVECFTKDMEEQGVYPEVDGKPVQLFGKVSTAMVLKCMLVGLLMHDLDDQEFLQQFAVTKEEIRKDLDRIAVIFKEHEETGSREKEAELTELIAKLIAIADGPEKETVQ